ncbi:cobalamin B12-binding domain-containing protein [Nocardia thailandica]
MTSPDSLDRERETLWASVLEMDEDRALDLVRALIDHGVDAETVLLKVIAPVQLKVGEEWAANRMTVAQEHAATAINDRAVAALPRRSATPRAASGKVTVACVAGEWHALPARLLAEVLRIRGWQVDFLGAQLPTHHLIAHLHSHNPDVVALSASLATRLPDAHATITACQATSVPVIVGGAAFGRDGRYARTLGADGWARDAPDAADLLATGFPRATRRRSAGPVDGLPHLLDQEYTMVSTTVSSLVAGTMAGLEQHYPPVRQYRADHRERTAEDLRNIVEFLAAALYVDDDELFGDFIAWTSGVLAARQVPSRALLSALSLLEQQLTDFPRARRILAASRSVL